MAAWRATPSPQVEIRRARAAVAAAYYSINYQARLAAQQSADYASCAAEKASRERKQQCVVLRDLFNPFHCVCLDPAWLKWNSNAIPCMAQAIYDERAYNRLPILADALEEAGCDDPDLLNHCRQPGEHLRGCWVIDLLLGKN
jgi:hypothetical protein